MTIENDTENTPDQISASDLVEQASAELPIEAGETPDNGVSPSIESDPLLAPFSPNEIEDAKKEYFAWKESQSAPSSQKALDPAAFANAVKEAVAPLYPKVPEAPKSWEKLEDHFKNGDLKSFIGAFQDWIKHQQDQYHTEKIAPHLQRVDALGQLVPQLYYRSQVNPLHDKAVARAQEISKIYGTESNRAFQIAWEEVNRQVAPQSPQGQVSATVQIPKGSTTPKMRPKAANTQKSQLSIDQLVDQAFSLVENGEV